MVSMNSGSSNTPECQKNYTYIGHNIGQKSMYYKKNLISSALIGGLVEMDRVFPYILYMLLHISLKVKE